MLRRFPVRRPSPAMVVALFALFVALGGSAVAAVVVTSNNQVARDTISGHHPPAGARPNLITNSVGGQDVRESTLGTVPDAAALGGSPASKFQRRVGGSCDRGRGIAAINANGSVTCASGAVRPISINPPNGGSAGALASQNLLLRAGCGTGNTYVMFINQGPGAGTLNWMFSQGTSGSTSVNASGDVIASFGQITFAYANSGRLEGQWIFSDGGGVTTVNLHAFKGADFCEVRGTASWAPTG